jgi:hypothetical protein
LKAAILGQESGNGTADTSQPNYAGAIGPGQIIPTTFDALKNQGLIPKDYDINNPAHNRAASGALLDHLMEKYADDPSKAAAAYYAGEKAVRPDGSVANYRDRKNPNAPTVFQYQDQVLHRMGPEYDNGTFAGSPVLPSFQTAPPTIDDWSNTPGNGPKAPRSIMTPKETNDILPKAGPLTGPDVNSANLVATTKELQDETAHYDAHGIIPTAIDLAAHQGITGVLIRAIADQSHGKPQPGYVPSVVDKDLYAGRTEADHQYLDEATNHMDALRRDLAIQHKDDDMKEAATQGTATTIMASLVGGLPEGFGIGGVAARTMTLARTARTVMAARAGAEADATANLLRASQGFDALPKTAPTVAAPGIVSHFAEQALGNVGAVGVQQAFDPYVSKDDYMMAAFNTLLFTGISGIGHAFHPSDAVVARQIGQAGADDAGLKINTIRQKALDNLGADASPESLRAEAARLEGNEVRSTITAATSAVGEDRRLIPDVETLAKDIADKRAEAEASATPAPEGTKPSETKPVDDGEVVPVSSLPTVDNPAAKVTTLPEPLAKGAPRFSYSRRGFNLDFASDLDKAAFIARENGTRSKADAAYVDFVSKATGMTEAEIRAHGNTVHQTIKAQAKMAEPGITELRIPDHAANPAPEAASMHLGTIPGESTTRVAFRSENPTFYHDVGSARVREHLARNDPAWRANVAELGEGTTMEHIDTLPKGTHIMPGAAADPVVSKVGAAIKDLADQFLKKSKIIVGKVKDVHDSILAQQAQKAGGKGGVPNGAVVSAGNVHVIGVKSRNLEGAMLTGIHELGHAIFHENLAHIPPKLLARMAAAHQSFIKDLAAGKATARFKRLSASEENLGGGRTITSPLPDNAYAASFDEYTAEAYVRYIQDKVNAGTGPKMNATAVNALKEVWNKIKALWEYAKGKGYLGDDEPFHEFFDHVMNGSLKDADKIPVAETTYLDPGLTLDFNTHFDPAAQKIGSDLMPQKTVQQEAEAQAVVGIHKQAAAYAAKNPVNVQRLSKLLKNTVFDPISSVMLRSSNPVVRMISAELIENGAGAGGRRSTAALAKWIHEQAFMGNAINDSQKQYVEWRNLQGGNWTGDFMDGKLRATFDKMVAQEIEGRKPGGTKVASPDQVIKAADVFEAAYERMRTQQVATKTTGWASLPESSVGYMPHRMSRDAVLNLTVGPEGVAKTNALHAALTDQFMGIEGFDPSFSAELASKYIDRVKRSALGGYEAPGGIHQVGAADIVEEALQSMGLDREQVRAMMGRYMAGGPGHTKRRLQLDLTAEHDNGVGGTFTLMDLFETNQLKLLRSQAGRVSGEVALAQHGVMGKSGLALLRRAMEFGDHGPASAKEFEAFDQMAAEFLGAPFGTAAGKYAERAMQLNSLARLGGMGFQQAAEYINGIVHVGAARTASAIAGMPRLRAEAAALARGEKIDNPILSSLEVNGAEFGTHPYKMVFPFDEESHGSAQVYGQDTPTFLDRALRGASHVQAKLSFWRAIHGAQHRGFAEQIVHKAMKFVRNGGDDIALNDMGIGKDLRDKLAAELGNIAEFNSDGSLQRFDITKMKDTQAAAEFIQAVHRGTNQIIQGTFIGETGKWAHSGFLRLLTQFRSFGIASIEKQWGRQVGNHGTAAALGMVLGSMSLAAPIYIAKVALNAQGRKDKQAYLDRMLTASAIASATLNLVSTTGLASDFLDATKAVTGLGTGSGGRAGQGSDLVGGVVAPAAGLANDLYKGIQNTKKGTNPHDLLKALPFSNLPGMTPAIEGLFGK